MTVEEYMRLDAKERQKTQELVEARIERKIKSATGSGKTAFTIWVNYKAYELDKLGFEDFTESEDYQGYKTVKVRSGNGTYTGVETCLGTVTVSKSVKFVPTRNYDCSEAYKQSEIYANGFLKYKEMRDVGANAPKLGETLLFNLFSVFSAAFSLLFILFAYALGRGKEKTDLFGWQVSMPAIYIAYALSLICMIATVIVYYTLLKKYNLKSGKKKNRGYYAKDFAIAYLILAGIMGTLLVVACTIETQFLKVNDDLIMPYTILSVVYFVTSFIRFLIGNPRRKLSSSIRKKNAYFRSEECKQVEKAMEYLKAL